MKKVVAVGLVLVLMLFLLSSCAGISQEVYDRVSSELVAAQAQIQSLQGELAEAQAQIQPLQAELAEAQAQTQPLQAELAEAQAQIQPLQADKEALSSELVAAQAQFQSLQAGLTANEAELAAKDSELGAIKGKLELGKTKFEIFNTIFGATMTGELDRMTGAEVIMFFSELQNMVNSVGDPVLAEKFETILTPSNGEVMNSFFLYILESTADTLK